MPYDGVTSQEIKTLRNGTGKLVIMKVFYEGKIYILENDQQKSYFDFQVKKLSVRNTYFDLF
jgi:hypothetical protein